MSCKPNAKHRASREQRGNLFPLCRGAADVHHAKHDKPQTLNLKPQRKKELFLSKKEFFIRLLEYIVVILHAVACILGAHGRAVTLSLFLSFFLAEPFYQNNMRGVVTTTRSTVANSVVSRLGRASISITVRRLSSNN